MAVSGAVAVVAAAGAYSAYEGGQAADAQRASANQQQRQAMDAAQSPEAIAQLQQSNNINNQNLQRQQAILASTDPAIIGAGQQALQLLNGQSAAVLKPIQDQRTQQRAQLQQQLQQQLGSGYATSSAGQAALSQFDQQTSDLMANAQQNTLGQLLGTVSPFSQSGLSQETNASNQIAQGYQNNAALQVSAITGTAPQVINSSTAGTVGNILGAQAVAGGAKGFASAYGASNANGPSNAPTSGVNNVGTFGSSGVGSSGNTYDTLGIGTLGDANLMNSNGFSLNTLGNNQA